MKIIKTINQRLLQLKDQLREMKIEVDKNAILECCKNRLILFCLRFLKALLLKS